MYEMLNPKATLVALNYNFLSANEFIEKVSTKKLLEKYSLKREEPSLKLKDGIIPPPQVINDIRNFLPLSFLSNDTTIKIIYTQQELKLVINKVGIDTDNFKNYSELSYDFIDLKMSDINAIGMNYSAEYNLKEDKLLLLSSEAVKAVPDFESNISFEVVLPIYESDNGVLKTYRIRKSSKDEALDHIYEISVNYHFDVSQMTTAQKSEKIDQLLSIHRYDEFCSQCQRFLEVNNGKSNKK